MFKPGLSKRQTAAAEPAGADPFSEVLGLVIEDLGGLNRNTEQDFLAIGTRLQAFSLTCRELNRASATVLEFTAGAELQASIAGLGGLLLELDEHIKNLEQQFEESLAILERYRGLIARVSSSAQDFRQMIINLNMLGFLTRVENSHLYREDSGFASLAEDVAKLSGNIRLRSNEIGDQAVRLATVINASAGRVLDRETSRRQQARRIMETTKASHQALVERQAQAEQVARSLDAQAAAIAAAIAEIVSGLQFNDITRQQLEHVAQALDGLREALNRPDGVATLIEKAGATLEIAGLQLAQIQHADRELATAVGDVIAGLDGIAAATGAMLEGLERVSWSADSTGRDFMSEISAGMDSIIAGLDDSGREQAELAGAMEEVSRMVGEMAAFVADIERLGVELQLIALNARIKAARIGSEGLTLDTISGSIYELSSNSRNETGLLAGMLQELVGLAQSFNAHFADDKRLNQELGDRLRESFNREHQILKALNHSVAEQLAGIRQVGTQLIEDLAEVAGSISVHTTVAAVLAQQAKRLTELNLEAERLCAGADLSRRPVYLEQLSQRYTMDSERRIHLGHMGAAEAELIGAGDDLGDNVDLF